MTRRGTGAPRRRPGINPAEVYEALGPITPQEHQQLTHMSPSERNRWISNIYGPATSPYAKTQHLNHTRRQTT